MAEIPKKQNVSKFCVAATGVVVLSVGATILIGCDKSEMVYTMERADANNDGTHILNSIIHDWMTNVETLKWEWCETWFEIISYYAAMRFCPL